MKLPNFKNQKGFTLIELLVVVVVISALSGIVVSMINSGGFRDKAQDAQRISDLKQIQTALELYFSDFRQYPATVGWIRIDGTDDLTTVLSPTYINKMPVDPEHPGGTGGPCADPENTRYNYRSDDGSYYLLTAIMEIDSSNDDSLCDALNNWGGNCGGGAFDTQDFCYGVENP